MVRGKEMRFHRKGWSRRESSVGVGLFLAISSQMGDARYPSDGSVSTSVGSPGCLDINFDITELCFSRNFRRRDSGSMPPSLELGEGGSSPEVTSSSSSSTNSWKPGGLSWETWRETGTSSSWQTLALFGHSRHRPLRRYSLTRVARFQPFDKLALLRPWQRRPSSTSVSYLWKTFWEICFLRIF